MTLAAGLARPIRHAAAPVAPARLLLHEMGHLVPRSDPEGRWVGRRHWAERGLVLAGRSDPVCLADPVDPGFLGYLATLGLGPDADRIVVPADDGRSSLVTRLANDSAALGRLARLLAGAPVRLEPFIADATVFALATRLGRVLGRTVPVLGGSPGVVRAANRKDAVRRRAIELGIPVAPGEVVRVRVRRDGSREVDRLDAVLRRRLARSPRLLVRGVDGSGGASIYPVQADDDSREAVCRAVAAERTAPLYLVEEFLPLTESPNLLVEIHPDDRRVSLVAATDQRWTRPFQHGGNQGPSAARMLDTMWAAARRLAAGFAAEGYTGPLGFDFGEYRDPHTGAWRWILAEANGRTNGSSYPLAVMRRLNRTRSLLGLPTFTGFASGRLSTTARSFGDLRDLLGARLYTGAGDRGIVPLTIGTLASGYVLVTAVAESRAAAAHLLEEFT